MLARLPTPLKTAAVVHAHAGPNTNDVRRLIQNWRSASAAGQVLPVAPPRAEPPASADLAIMIPRAEAAPTALARCLLSAAPLALLLPIDLASQSCSPNLCADAPSARVETAFTAAGELTTLATQVLWVIGNIAGCTPIEIVSSQLATPAPLTSLTDASNKFTATAPQTIENWILAQKQDPDLAALCTKIQHAATRDGLVVCAPPDSTPKIVVPPAACAALVRHQHLKMLHLGSAKVLSTLAAVHHWPMAYHACRRQEVPERLPRL
jgi:hypothetical protein